MPAVLAALALVVAAAATPPTITLLLCDAAHSLHSDGATLRAEVAAQLEGTGLALRFKTVAAGRGFESHEGEMLVVLLPTEMRNPGHERVLGVVIGDHQFPSPIWVSVGNVSRVLGVQATDTGASDRLETALGRVVAHEVIHAFLPERPHSGTGLMARAVNRDTLTRPGTRLDDDCLGALALALRDPLMRLRVSGPALAALTAEP